MLPFTNQVQDHLESMMCDLLQGPWALQVLKSNDNKRSSVLRNANSRDLQLACSCQSITQPVVTAVQPHNVAMPRIRSDGCLLLTASCIHQVPAAQQRLYPQGELLHTLSSLIGGVLDALMLFTMSCKQHHSQDAVTGLVCCSTFV